MLVKIAKIGNQNITLRADIKKKQFGVDVIVPVYYFARMIVAEEDRDALIDTEFTLKSYDVIEQVSPEGVKYQYLENMVEA